MDQRIVLPALQEFLRVRQHLKLVFIVRRGKIDERFTQHSAHARGLGFFRDRILEVIHVRKSGDAAANLLRSGQTRAPAHKFFGDVLGFRGKNIFAQPVVQRHIVMQPAKQRHGHVRVPVDEARQHQLAARVDGLRRSIFIFDVGAETDGRDDVALHGHRSVFNNQRSSVHGDDGAAADQQVHLFFVA